MSNIKLYEEWWWGKSEPKQPPKEKLTHIEEVQEEPEISKDEIQNAVDTYFKFKKKTKFYLNAFHSHKTNDYFDKFILFYHKTIEQLYRLWKIKDSINIQNFNFDEELSDDSRQYDGTKLTGDYLIKKIKDITFWLNVMDPRSKVKDVYYYEIEVKRSQYGRFNTTFEVCETKNRLREEKKREEHKEVDPFSEEEWKDENK